MTQDMKKWSDMTARERDALIAEKVMELLVIKSHFSAHLFSTEHPSGHVPNYTTDISAAWEVFDKFPLNNLTRGQEGWTCRYGIERENTITQVDAHAPTAPEAICLAACKLLGLVES